MLKPVKIKFIRKACELQPRKSTNPKYGPIMKYLYLKVLTG